MFIHIFISIIFLIKTNNNFERKEKEVLYMARGSKNNTNLCDYISNGISISPAVVTPGEQVKVIYDGLLAKNGANHVYAKVGFGNKWDNENYYQMTKSTTGFEATIPVTSSDTLNLVFKDCANNWDNNSGRNYTIDITQ